MISQALTCIIQASLILADSAKGLAMDPLPSLSHSKLMDLLLKSPSQGPIWSSLQVSPGQENLGLW